MTKRQRAEQKLANVLRFARINGVIKRDFLTGKFDFADNQTGRGLRPRLARAFARCERRGMFSAEAAAPSAPTAAPMVVLPQIVMPGIVARPGGKLPIMVDAAPNMKFTPTVVAAILGRMSMQG